MIDEKNQRLLAARDRFGEKPFYWTLFGDGGIAFASEMKALMSFPGLDRNLDVAAIAQFLALRYVPAPRTHLQGVRKRSADLNLSLRIRFPTGRHEFRRVFSAVAVHRREQDSPGQWRELEPSEVKRLRARSNV